MADRSPKCTFKCSHEAFFHHVIFTAAIGASRNPCMQDYCGSSPESEIEVQNVANFIRMHKSDIKSYITIHSYSQMVLFPYSYTYALAADHSELVGHPYFCTINYTASILGL